MLASLRNRQMFVVFDLDGTLADDLYRRHHVKREPGDQRPRNFDAYHEAANMDDPREPLVVLMNLLYFAAHRVEIWTGRDEAYREETRGWLYHRVGPWTIHVNLRMRPTGEYSLSANDMKGMWAEEDGWPDLVFDDRQQCVDWWESKGVLCCQVAQNT